jgi:hypothetical protein
VVTLDAIDADRSTQAWQVRDRMLEQFSQAGNGTAC